MTKHNTHSAEHSSRTTKDLLKALPSEAKQAEKEVRIGIHCKKVSLMWLLNKYDRLRREYNKALEQAKQEGIAIGRQAEQERILKIIDEWYNAECCGYPEKNSFVCMPFRLRRLISKIKSSEDKS